MDRSQLEEFARLSIFLWLPDGDNQVQRDQGCGPWQVNTTPSPEKSAFMEASGNKILTLTLTMTWNWFKTLTDLIGYSLGYSLVY